MFQDIRHGIAAFVRTPGFTVAAVLSLAIGVGVNTSIYSVASALLLHPLAVRRRRAAGDPMEPLAGPWHHRGLVFDGAVLRHQGRAAELRARRHRDWRQLQPDRRRRRARTRRDNQRVLGTAADAWGPARAWAGLFVPEEDHAGAPGTALLGHGTWMRRYGGDPNIVGRQLVLNGQPYQVVGVLPSSFSLPREVLPTLGGAENAEIVIPLPLAADAPAIRTAEDYNILAKLKPGVSVQQAQAELDALTARLRRDHPGVLPAQQRPDLQRRAAAGAGRRRCAALAARADGIGGLGAVDCLRERRQPAAVARRQPSEGDCGARRARRQPPPHRPPAARREPACSRRWARSSPCCSRTGASSGSARSARRACPRIDEIAINAEVLLFTLCDFARRPACSSAWRRRCRLSRVDLQANLKDAGRGSAGASSVWASGGNLRRLLVISELALSVVLLIGAGLLIRSFARLQDVPPGFNPVECPDARADDDGPQVQRCRSAFSRPIGSCGNASRHCQASPPRAA